MFALTDLFRALFKKRLTEPVPEPTYVDTALWSIVQITPDRFNRIHTPEHSWRRIHVRYPHIGDYLLHLPSLTERLACRQPLDPSMFHMDLRGVYVDRFLLSSTNCYTYTETSELVQFFTCIEQYLLVIRDMILKSPKDYMDEYWLQQTQPNTMHLLDIVKTFVLITGD